MRAFSSILLAVGLASAGYGASEVADAIQNRNGDALRAALKTHADVNAVQADGSTALLWAAHWNDLDSMKLLLAAGADPKIANRYGATPLAEAAPAGSAAMIEALLKAGADAKSLTTADGETVLMTAAKAGNLEVVKMLIARGADVNAKETYKGQTALMWAASEHHPEVVNVLLAAGADWKVKEFDRETRIPKLSAASSVSPIARGGMTAFLFAAREGDTATAQVMLDAGVDINQTDVDGANGLVFSIMNKQYTFAKYLLDHKADPNMVDVKGRGALYALVDMRNEDYNALPNRKELDPMPGIDLLKALLDAGANPNVPLTKPLPGRSGMDSGDTGLGDGATPLMRAARSGDYAAMKLLLAKGADSKHAAKDGTTAFLVAAGVGYRDKSTRGTEADALEAVKVALEQGADINQTSTRGETALHGAAGRGADTIVEFLIAHGAKIDAKNRQGQTPLDYAMGKNVAGQLPVPHDSTVVLVKRLGGVEGTRPQAPGPPRPVAQ